MPAKTAANDVAVTASSTETSVADLQRELQRVRQERDDLARDVEALCMSGADPTGISTSSVVSERIRIQDEQLADCRLRLEAALADAASLREDLTALRESKRIADQSWRAETARAANLERELQFYQTQSARAMSDRDRATWEADELKRRVGDLEQSIERERGLRIAEEAQRQQADAALAVAREQAEGLRAELAQLEALPALRQEVARLQDDVARLQDDVARAQASVAARDTRVEELERQLQDQGKRAAELEARRVAMDKELALATAMHQEEVFKLQSDIASLSNELFTARSVQDELDSSLAAAQAELESRRGGGEVASLQAELQAARAARAAAERDMQAMQAELQALRVDGGATPANVTPTKGTPTKSTPPRASPQGRRTNR